MTVAVPEPPHLVADLGKTHLAIALGMACCQHDYRVRFLTAAELTTLLVEAQQQGRLARKLDHLARFDVVIVDELGYVPFDKAGADLLFGFISRPLRAREPGRAPSGHVATTTRQRGPFHVATRSLFSLPFPVRCAPGCEGPQEDLRALDARGKSPQALVGCSLLATVSSGQLGRAPRRPCETRRSCTSTCSASLT